MFNSYIWGFLYERLLSWNKWKSSQKATIESMELSLLAKGDGTEVILQHIEAGKTFYVFPSERNETLEFFYILDGKCEYENKNHSTSLTKSDYFYVQELNDIVYFKAVTNIKNALD